MPALKQQVVPSAQAGSASTSNVSQQFGLVQVGGFVPAVVVPNVPLSWLPKYRSSLASPARFAPSMVHAHSAWRPTLERTHVGA